MCQVGGVPVDHRHQATRQVVYGAGGAQSVARAVAGRAMAQALHQVGAPVPLGALGLVGLKRGRLKKQTAPHGQGGLGAKRPCQAVGGLGLRHRRKGVQPRKNRVAVLPGDHAGVVVWKSRGQKPTVRRPASVHGLPKILRGPAAQAGFGVWCEVAAVHPAKRRVDAAAACQGRAASCGVAGHAVARQGQVAALINLALRGRGRCDG